MNNRSTARASFQARLSSERKCRYLQEPPEIDLNQRFDLDRGPVARLGARAAQKVMKGLFRIWFQLKMTGLEKLPERGPFLLCPNHQSYLDPFFIYALLPSMVLERTLFVGDKGNFQKPSLCWMNRFGRIVLTGRSGKMPECLRLTYDGLRRGMIVCMFPEGSRTKTGSVMTPYAGAGILACETAAPIVPVHIRGGLEVYSHFRPGLHFCKIALTVGDPIHPTGRNDLAILERWKTELNRMETAAPLVLDSNTVVSRIDDGEERSTQHA